MGKDKLIRFAENETFAHMFQPKTAEVLNNTYFLQNQWNKLVFKNQQPLILELGCGRGEYTVGMARAFPQKNFIGVDIKGARIWRGAKTVQEEQIPNAAFLRTRIEFIESCFGNQEVDEIWITFPDPQPKEKRTKKRLTSTHFLNRYKKFLKNNGIIHLKTDSRELYEYTLALIELNQLELLSNCSDLYADFPNDPILGIKTRYEEIFTREGKTITYLKFKLAADLTLIEPNPELLDINKGSDD